MNSIKRFAPLLCIALFLMSLLIIPSKAFNAEEHDRKMEDVLFKNFKNQENDFSIQDELKAIEYASYLAIDQFNNNGQDKLDYLNQFGVRDIPKNVGDISYNASGKTHRNYTHRGWNYDYRFMKQEMGKKWPIRQAILQNTVTAIFDFNGDERQKESFCKLIYYIHVIGDHLANKTWKNNGLMIEMGGRADQNDVIHELVDCFKTLFPDQLHTHKYISLTTNLQKYNSKFAKIVRSTGGINTDEEFEEYHQLTEGLMNLLTMYIPEMLKEEMFFSEVFYK